MRPVRANVLLDLSVRVNGSARSVGACEYFCSICRVNVLLHDLSVRVHVLLDLSSAALGRRHVGRALPAALGVRRVRVRALRPRAVPQPRQVVRAVPVAEVGVR